MGTITQLFKTNKQMVSPPVLQIDRVKDSFVLGLSALMLLSTEGTPPMLENSSCCFGRHTINFDQIVESLKNPKEKKAVLDDFVKMLYRSLVQDSVFIVEDYCEKSGRISLLHKEPWYPFAKAIKNCFSSGFRFSMECVAHDSLPVRWREKQITENMHGELLQSTFFDFDDAWDLVNEIRNFVDSLD